MIHVVRGRLSTAGAEAILRPVSTELEPVTHESHILEVMAGEAAMERFQATGGLPVGGAAITPGGEGLPDSFLIHVAVHSMDEPATGSGIRKGLLNALRRTVEWEVDSLALPPLGIGAGHLDAEASAAVMIEVLRNHLARSEYPKEVSVFVAGDYEEDVFSSELDRTSASS
jgi:O-acetyl-ADP-ribose deacetylase (regulator of RNase III)